METACTRVLNLLTTRVLLYSRHTSERRANGISIYFPHPLVPENIFQAHQAQYRENRFSRDTHWDEMIDLLRPLLKETLLSKPDRSSDKKKTGPFSGPAHNASLYR